MFAMRISSSPATFDRPGVLVTLAHLLERLERSGSSVDAGQYRLVASHLAQALATEAPGERLHAVLRTFPAAAELYENINYQYAGLCRSPLQTALDAEAKAVELIRRLGSGAQGAAPRVP